MPLGIYIVSIRTNREIFMKPGQMIKLRAYGNEVITRRLVRLDKDIVIVCQPEEYEAARLERREPVCVGFHVTDVINESIGDADKFKKVKEIAIINNGKRRGCHA
jgi:hypothetical protein